MAIALSSLFTDRFKNHERQCILNFSVLNKFLQLISQFIENLFQHWINRFDEICSLPLKLAGCLFTPPPPSLDSLKAGTAPQAGLRTPPYSVLLNHSLLFSTFLQNRHEASYVTPTLSYNYYFFKLLLVYILFKLLWKKLCTTQYWASSSNK